MHQSSRMTRARFSSLTALLVGAAGLWACGDADERTTVAEARSALNRSALPIFTGANATDAANKPMAETLTLAAQGNDATTACVDCKFTNGLNTQSIQSTSLAGYSTPVHDAANASQDDLRQAYTSLVPIAQSYLDDPTADRIAETFDDIETVLGLIPGVTVTATQPTSSTWARAFPPVYGRHIRRQVEGLQYANYPDPKLFRELTDRGARSYCAMREAARTQAQTPGSTRMLTEDLGEVLWWRAGVTEADLTLLPSGTATRSTGEPGAQAFVVPMAIGARVAPLAGPLLPDFGTLVHSLVWVTGDAEALTDEDWGATGILTQGYRKRYRNLAHMDLVAGKRYTGSLEIAAPTLINFGIFQVGLEGAINLDVGAVSVAPSDEEQFVGALHEGKVLYDSIAVQRNVTSAWPAARTDTLGLPDAPIGLNTNCVFESGLERPFADYVGSTTLGACTLHPYVGGEANTSWWMRPGWGTAARWRNDDDRAFTVTDRASVQIGVVGGAGFSFGIVDLNVRASMSVGVESRVDTVFREHLSATPKTDLLPIPSSAEDTLLQSNVVVTPIGTNTLEFDPLKVGLDLKVTLPWPIGTLQWSQRVFIKTSELPCATRRWSSGVGASMRSLREGRRRDSTRVYARIPC